MDASHETVTKSRWRRVISRDFQSKKAQVLVITFEEEDQRTCEDFATEPRPSSLVRAAVVLEQNGQ
jgi:hypothetical protein